jgi:hypothetical protein
MKITVLPRVRKKGSDIFKRDALGLYSCAICKVTGELTEFPSRGARIVRDHNHETGFIRGLLCNECNWNLGLLEKAPHYYYRRLARKEWRSWVYEFASEILKHLNSESRVVYKVPGRFAQFRRA